MTKFCKEFHGLITEGKGGLICITFDCNYKLDEFKVVNMSVNWRCGNMIMWIEIFNNPK